MWGSSMFDSSAFSSLSDVAKTAVASASAAAGQAAAAAQQVAEQGAAVAQQVAATATEEASKAKEIAAATLSSMHTPEGSALLHRTVCEFLALTGEPAAEGATPADLVPLMRERALRLIKAAESYREQAGTMAEKGKEYREKFKEATQRLEVATRAGRALQVPTHCSPPPPLLGSARAPLPRRWQAQLGEQQQQAAALHARVAQLEQALKAAGAEAPPPATPVPVPAAPTAVGGTAASGLLALSIEPAVAGTELPLLLAIRPV